MAAFTSEQLDTIIQDLELALGTGATSVSVAGRTVNYAGADDLRKAITYFQTLKAKLNGTRQPRPLYRPFNLGNGYTGTGNT